LVAFTSLESGFWDVYVQPFSRPGERMKISGGGQPKWRGDGKELFYVGIDGRLMAVEIKESADRIEVAHPVALFGGVNPAAGQDKYAATRDGQRFLVIVPTGKGTGGRIRVVTNWTSLLQQ
jgi:hypothetical protein